MHGDIILQKCSKNHYICYTIPKIWCVTDITLIFHLGLFCTFTHPPPSPPLTTQKIIIKKNEKNTWRYHHFTHTFI